MDLRPQAHDIIRTWLFDTVLRAHLEHDSLPWTNAAISGWVLDPDRKKMSKSKGNVVTPMALLEEHGSDGVRYWAASGRPGTDTAFDTEPDARRPAAGDQAAERVAGSRSRRPSRRARSRRRSIARCSARLAALVDEATARSRAATTTRACCSGPRSSSGASATTISSSSRAAATANRDRTAAASANSALAAALSVLLRLFAPFLPFVTEEVWSWWQEGSIHRAPWPTRRRARAPDRGRLAEPRGSAIRRSTSGRPKCCSRCGSSGPRRSSRCKVPITSVIVTARCVRGLIAMPAGRGRPASRRCACRRSSIAAGDVARDRGGGLRALR